jgi:hypothetical protein
VSKKKVRRPALKRKLVQHGMNEKKAERIANKPSSKKKGK